MNAREELRDLLKNSLIAGIPQVMGVKQRLRKIFRLGVMLLCLAGFMYQTSRFLEIYWSYPTVMDITVSFPDEVEVPAVSVCNHNGIRASIFCQRYPALCTPLKNLSDFCFQSTYFCDSNSAVANKTLPAVKPNQLPQLTRNEYRSMGVQKEDLIRECTIISSTKVNSCGEDAKWVSAFDSMGLPNNCYILNSLWGNRSGIQQKVKAKAFMVVIIAAETTDHFYTGTAHAIQISLHNPYIQVNPFIEGFPVQPCTNYYVYISKVVHLLLPPPYSTNCTNYFQKWQSRGGKGPLNKREELLMAALKGNGYTNAFISRTFREKNAEEEEKLEGRGTIFLPFTKAVDNNRFFKKCADFCSRACISEEMILEVEQHERLDDKANRKRSQQCFSVIVFAFNRMEKKTFRYLPKYEDVELFTYIGGYVGIWLGISLIAISDVLESLLILFKFIISKIKKTSNVKKRKSNHLFPSHPKIRVRVVRKVNTLQVL